MASELLTDPAHASDVDAHSRHGAAPVRLPLVSLVLPAYNEAAILERNLGILCDYMVTLEHRFRWEMIIVNDGSSDRTGQIIDRFAAGRDNVFALHHRSNFGLGQAFKYAFAHCRGDHVITLDVDLSYAPEHIEQLLDKLIATNAKLVLASPYMQGGMISNVPWLRRILSIAANRFLSFFSHGNLSTLTCMVRAYDGRFIRSLNLRGTGMEINPETVYKSMIMRAKIEQVPAHLDWGAQNGISPTSETREPEEVEQRKSSMRLFRHIVGTLLSGFIFRPFMFFVLPGMALLVFALYVNVWMIVHFFEAYASLPLELPTDRVSVAVATAYEQYPHTFIVGLLSLMLAIQLVSLGILALQSKTYFEEIFHLGTAIKRQRDVESAPTTAGGDRSGR